MKKKAASIKDTVINALLEDAFDADVTTKTVLQVLNKKNIDSNFTRNFVIVAKQDGVFSGYTWVQAFAQVVEHFDLKECLQEGQPFQKGQTVLVAQAPWALVLAIERTLLNGLQHTCGIASLTARLVSQCQALAKAKGIKKVPGIYHTRKTLPGLRELEVQAVLAGGGKKHRVNLQERILVKENHKQMLQLAGIPYDRWAAELLRSSADAEFEVESVEEARALVAVGVRYLLLDNFSIAMLHDFLNDCPENVEVELSGGINEENLADYVLPKVSRISLGALTHSVKAVDLGLDWQ